jgi:hypothetical protein
MTVSFLRGDRFCDRRNHPCHTDPAQSVPHAAQQSWANSLMAKSLGRFWCQWARNCQPADTYIDCTHGIATAAALP